MHLSDISKTETARGEIPSLNGWRAASITLVFLSHAGLGQIIPGGLGVTIFFFLSGFLITSLLIKEFEKTGTISLPKFYARRFLRLMPVIVIVLVPTYLLTASGLLRGSASVIAAVSQLFYFFNYFAIFHDFGSYIPTGTVVFWSLSVEEHYYIFFPFLLLFLLRKCRGNTIVHLFCGLCAAALAWRFYLTYVEGVSPIRTFFATDTRIDSILYGSILAIIWRREWNFERSIKRMRTDYALAACGGLLILISVVVRSEVFRESLRYSLQGVALIPIFIASIRYHDMAPFNVLNLRFMKKMGDFSYAIYLVHFVILSNVLVEPGNELLRGVLAAALAIAFAALNEVLFDVKLRRLRARLH